MSKRQWQILAYGIVAMVVVAAAGISRPQSPIAGPVVEYAPGEYSQNNMHLIMPMWAVLTTLGLSLLTGLLVYRERS